MADVAVDSTALNDVSLVSTQRYVGPVTVVPLPRVVQGRADYVTGNLGKGIGRVRGTVKNKASPVNAPVYRQVRLIRGRDGRLVREQWSDPLTGAYDFQWIDELEAYIVLSRDHTRTFSVVANDNQTLANGGVELMP